jgi:hypothetical protein
VKGQLADVRHSTQVLTAGSPGLVSQIEALAALQSEFCRQSTQVLLAELHTVPKQVLTPQGIPPASKPPVGPQIPVSHEGFSTGQSESAPQGAHGPGPPTSQKGSQAPKEHASPEVQSAAVRHWTQSPTQYGVPAFSAAQSLSVAHWAQPKSVQTCGEGQSELLAHWRQNPAWGDDVSVWHTA